MNSSHLYLARKVFSSSYQNFLSSAFLLARNQASITTSSSIKLISCDRKDSSIARSTYGATLGVRKSRIILLALIDVTFARKKCLMLRQSASESLSSRINRRGTALISALGYNDPGSSRRFTESANATNSSLAIPESRAQMFNGAKPSSAYVRQ